MNEMSNTDPRSAVPPSTDPDPAEHEEPATEEALAAHQFATTDRIFGLLTVGVMALLLVCVVLVVIAYQRAPAGL